MRKSMQWSEKEDQLILSNISLITSKKWKVIANILKEQGFTKKETECRERYINHLSLSLDKNEEITFDDLTIFYQKYEEFGPRWTQIQHFLPNKSQVELKNIFYGNIRCFIKKVIKHFTNKTAVFVNKFDTFTLQNIFSGKKNYKGLTFVKQDIKSMNYQFDETRCFNLIEAREQNYRMLFNVLLEEEETKKSKNYKCFQRFSLSHGKKESENFVKSNNSQNQLQMHQLPLPLIQSSIPFGIDVSNQNSPQNAYSCPQLHNMSWNEPQYLYITEPISWGPLIKPEAMNFYSPGPQLFYSSYPTFPTYINNSLNQNINFFRNPWN